MTVQTSKQFPEYAEELRGLVTQHRKIRDEPLLLAIYYKPRREEDDVFLFEVIGEFGAGAIDEDRELFEVTYPSSTNFPLEAGQRLHLVLTNPQEYEVAVQQGWKHVQELREAIKSSDFQVLYSDPDHANLRALINA
jgi:hypothetical protein